MTARSRTRRAPLWVQIAAQSGLVLVAMLAFLLGPAALATLGWGAVLVASIALFVIAVTMSNRAPRYRRGVSRG